MYYALTVNNLELTEKYKSIDSLYEYLKCFCKDINYIAVERNELNENIHYHILCEDYVDLPDICNIYIWNKTIEVADELQKYINYLKKDGHYKVYKIPPFIFEESRWYERAYSLICSKESLLEVFEADLSLMKYYNQISRMWDLKHGNPYLKSLLKSL